MYVCTYVCIFIHIHICVCMCVLMNMYSWLFYVAQKTDGTIVNSLAYITELVMSL